MGQADSCPMGGNIMMQAVIMAGGKGTRLAALTKDATAFAEICRQQFAESFAVSA